MPRGIRYSAEAKARLTEEAKQLREQRLTLNEAAERLGISVPFLSRLLKESGGGPRRSNGTAAAMSDANPVTRMAAMKTRLEAIDTQMEALRKERETLAARMREEYESLGRELFHG